MSEPGPKSARVISEPDLRSARIGPPPAGFAGVSIPVFSEALLTGSQWVRLCRTSFTSQFYAAKTSRLTPNSWRFPCAYIAASRETAVAEVWGDRLSFEKGRGGSVFVIPATKAGEYAFLTMGQPPPLRLCNFTDAKTRLAIGLENGALYSPDLTVPQAWAEMIASHPQGFDGIVYRSRHTDELCAVLWSRPGNRDLAAEIVFSNAEPFLDSSVSFAVAGKIGIKLSFAR